MEEQPRRFRSEKKPPTKGKGDRILNYLIALVVVLIIVVAGFIFSDNGKNTEVKDAPKETVKEQPKEQAKEQAKNKEEKEPAKKEEQSEKVNEQQPSSTEQTVTVENLKKSETAKVTTVNDQIVEEAIEDATWKPYKTSQEDSGAAHNSSYDQKSVDWKEKISAIAQITGLNEEDMTVWFVKNNGSSDSAIGTVSSKDQTKKYRVSLKWVSKEGWQPVKVEVLKQIKGAY